ncbi:MAG TPA: gluconate 2-dehydrogenase subunit 3 family protein [Bryobacteraceae bacterium]|nr:gluconate 2-dehydrogenase subunit 3 family protein [Bryobacteraceae bacterium]
MKRREFLLLPAASLGGVLVYTLGREPLRVHAQTGEIQVPLRFFTAAEARIVQAACARIFPSDESGPGATEAGVVIYIDRQLAGPYGRDKYRYAKAPFVESVPEHGYQGKASPREIYREGIKQLEDFASLDAAAQDRRLHAIETTTFFRMLRQHTIEGMFSDPLHGGNAGLIGWQLIGYPGPLMSYREEIDKLHGQPFRRKPVSLAQVVGHPVVGWEEEKD